MHESKPVVAVARHVPATRALRALLAAIVVTLVAAPYAGCDASDAEATDEALVGLWVNVDGTTIRAFDFHATAPDGASAALAAKPFVYELYFYQAGETPTVVQRGHYSVQFGRLVTEVVEAPLDASQAGRMFGNDVRGFSSTTLTLQSDSAASGERKYKASTALP